MTCEAITRDTWWRKSKNEKCHFEARIEIDGKKLCQRHASMIAIKLMLKQGTAQWIPHPSDEWQK